MIRKVNNLWLKYLHVAIGEEHSNELEVRILNIYVRKYSFWLSKIEKKGEGWQEYLLNTAQQKLMKSARSKPLYMPLELWKMKESKLVGMMF